MLELPAKRGVGREHRQQYAAHGRSDRSALFVDPQSPSGQLRGVTSILIFGASGYAGLELCGLLGRHPSAVLRGASSDKLRGQRIQRLAPGFSGDLAFIGHAELLEQASGGAVAFLATPAETSLELAPRLLAKGTRVIDLSGAFRLRDASLYPTWYGFTHTAPELLSRAHYGLPELFPLAPATTTLVANPGCYATAAALAAAPLVLGQLIELDQPLILDGKSGVTGAGRRSEEAFSFSEVAGTIRPYRLGKHQHVPEIEQCLGGGVQLSFSPHLIPIRRGLLVSGYARARLGVTAAQIQEAFIQRYQGRPFVQVLTETLPEPGPVTHTNVCTVGAHLDPRTRVVSFFGALDNLLKGAAGQAVQNLNLLIGADLSAGLR